MSHYSASSSLESSVTILVVDEHPAVARAIARVMESRDSTVIAAESLAEARRLALQLKPGVVVMGVEGESGVEFLDELRVLPNGPEIIVHTDSSRSATAHWASMNEVQEVFEKPAAPSVLVDWTARLLRRRRGEPESMTLQRSHLGVGRLLGEAPSICTLRDQVLKVAEFPLMSVLICGETGTGKELVARAIHELTCPDAPFISLNCAAIPENLFESELFGHCAGAFTGAKSRRAGLLEEAQAGTFFLDEVGELPALMQPKLLRVLETRTFRPVGGNRELPLEARIVAATNRTLSQARETFRPDLYYRLAGFALDTPSLRNRRQDILLLASTFLRDFCRFHGRPMMQIASSAADLLIAYDWPGNVRELRGVIENAAVSAHHGSITRSGVKDALGSRGAAMSGPPAEGLASMDVTPPPSSIALPTRRAEFDQFANGVQPSAPLGMCRVLEEIPSSSSVGVLLAGQAGPPSSGRALVGKGAAFSSLPELEQHVITGIYYECHGNLSLAARTLGIPRSTLRDRLKKYGISHPASQKHLSHR